MGDDRSSTIAPTGDQARERNRLLQALAPEDYAALLPLLREESLEFNRVIVEAEQPIDRVYFVRQGVCSMLAAQQEGGIIEVGTIGNEGLVGLPVLMGIGVMPTRGVMQVRGNGVSVDAREFSEFVEEHHAARRLFLRYAQHYTDQLTQSVACNRLHTVEERCARWLLMTRDRVEGGQFEMTHEYLSMMLGVRRAGVTVAMGVLQEAGTIRYTRGRVTILNDERLEASSCDCYAIVRKAMSRLFA